MPPAFDFLTGVRDEIGAHIKSVNPPRRPDFVERLHREKSGSAAEFADDLSGANIRLLQQALGSSGTSVRSDRDARLQ